MTERTRPQPRTAPLPADHSPEMREAFAVCTNALGFIPNSILIMQRKRAMVKALAQLAASRLLDDTFRRRNHNL